jgi:hypothetical protein
VIVPNSDLGWKSLVKEAAGVEVAGARAASTMDAFGGPVPAPSWAKETEVPAEAMTNSVTNTYLIHILLVVVRGAGDAVYARSIGDIAGCRFREQTPPE